MLAHYWQLSSGKVDADLGEHEAGFYLQGCQISHAARQDQTTDAGVAHQP